MRTAENHVIASCIYVVQNVESHGMYTFHSKVIECVILQ